jgi:hypothetical protein
MALGAGSIAFVGFDADGNNRLAIVAVDELPAGTVITITDRAWNGTSFQTGNAEGTLTWTVPAGGIQPGTIVSFDNVHTGSPTLAAEQGGVTTTAGTITRAGGFEVGTSNEVIYAYTGSDSSPNFLAAIANDGFGEGTGTLPSSLTLGETAIDLGDVDRDADFGVYKPAVGGSDFGSDRDAMLAAVNNTANWMITDGDGDQSSSFVPFLTNPASPLESVDFVICFLTGTRIATPSGEVAIEALAPGDTVLTAAGEARTVRWIGRQTLLSGVARRRGVLPVRVSAGALGENLPVRDLLVSPAHALAIDGMLVQAGALVNGTTIRTEAAMPWSFRYWHIELDAHELLLAEGMAAESFVDNVEPTAFDNAAERPAFPAIAEMALPRALSHRQVPASIRRLVAERAALLDGPKQAVA